MLNKTNKKIYINESLNSCKSLPKGNTDNTCRCFSFAKCGGPLLTAIRLLGCVLILIYTILVDELREQL